MSFRYGESMATVSLEELISTVNRMESRLHKSKAPNTVNLMAVYESVSKDFERDLKGAERDILLCKAGALMIIQERDK